MKFIWIMPIIGALMGSLTFLATLGLADSAPKEAAGYAMAMALAVIPYVLAKAIYTMGTTKVEADARRIAEAVEHLAKTAKCL